MPEGPEVENVRRELLILLNKKITLAELTPLALKYGRYQEQEENIPKLKGQRLIKIERQSKYLLWVFESKIVLNHLGMTGKWILLKNNENSASSSHPKVVLIFEDINRVIFDDVRNFGQFKIFDSELDLRNVKALRNIGIDGLATNFPQIEFENLLLTPRNINKPLGELLLDSRLVAGIGNIYKSEILFLAKLHPLICVDQLTKIEIKKLGTSISSILHQALKLGGSTINNYRSPSFRKGEAQFLHAVYGKEKKPCRICHHPIKKIVQKQRSTFFCPKCQATTRQLMQSNSTNREKRIHKRKSKK